MVILYHLINNLIKYIIYKGTNMSKYSGITVKVSADGSKNIFVRFQHFGTRYPVKNFTKLFGCRTEKQAFDKLQEIKTLISQGNDPFSTSSLILNDIWKEWSDKKIKNKDWSFKTKEGYAYFYNAYIKSAIGSKPIPFKESINFLI